MKLLLLAVFGLLLPAVAFAQKNPPDPDLRDKRAVAVDSHKSHPSDIAAPRKNSTSRELAKIERGSVQKPKTTHTPAAARTPTSAPLSTGEARKDKPIKFSYQPPVKTSSNTHPSPAPVQPHKKSE